jgi:broad specificity phosphatase PhoE
MLHRCLVLSLSSSLLLLIPFHSIIMTAQALSSSTSAKDGWTPSAIQLAKELSISQREKLRAEEGVVQDWPVQITATRLGSTTTSANDNDESSPNTITKIIHFQRHGQGYHNLLGEILRDAGVKLDIDSRDPKINPWIRPEIVDSPLTELGKEQCHDRRPEAALLNPQLVVVSPLLRAIQTAKISFGDHDRSEIPWVAHEGCREELGVLVCNQRRPLSQIQADYPELQFHGDISEEDTLWDPQQRESGTSKSDRIYQFLVDFVAQRPEQELAVVGHSAWLFHMCNAIVDCGEDTDLTSWFLTSEIRSMRLSFTTTQQ